MSAGIHTDPSERKGGAAAKAAVARASTENSGGSALSAVGSFLSNWLGINAISSALSFGVGGSGGMGKRGGGGGLTGVRVGHGNGALSLGALVGYGVYGGYGIGGSMGGGGGGGGRRGGVDGMGMGMGMGQERGMRGEGGGGRGEGRGDLSRYDVAPVSAISAALRLGALTVT